jgi:hypothetical protein
VFALAAAWSQPMPENRIDILRFSDGIGMRTEAFILELAYLQDIKHVDITKLTRTELDKIYEDVHKAGQDTLIGKIINKFGNAAANSVSIKIEYGVGMGASIDVGRAKVGGEVTSSLGGSLYFGVGAGGKITFDWLEFNALLFN